MSTRSESIMLGIGAFVGGLIFTTVLVILSLEIYGTGHKDGKIAALAECGAAVK